MTWKHIATIVGLVVLVLLITLGISRDFFVFRSDREAAAELQAQVGRFMEENKALDRDIDYYKNPNNLEKELKARFNYKRPGEELLIVVPGE